MAQAGVDKLCDVIVGTHPQVNKGKVTRENVKLQCECGKAEVSRVR